MVRMVACSALRWAPAELAVPLLVRVIRDRTELSSVRAEAMEALSYQPPAAVPKAILLFGLRDGSPAVRFFAAYASGELRVPSTKCALERMVENDHGPPASVESEPRREWLFDDCVRFDEYEGRA